MSLHESMNVEDHAALDRRRSSPRPSTRRWAGPIRSAPTRRWSNCCATSRRNGFTCYIVSGGGRDFMRPITSDDLRHPARTRRRQFAGAEVRGRGRPRRLADPARAGRLRRRPREAGAHLEPHRPAADPGRGQLQRRRRDADVLGHGRARRRCGCWSCTMTPSANSTTPQGRNALWTTLSSSAGPSSASRTTGRPSSVTDDLVLDSCADRCRRVRSRTTPKRGPRASVTVDGFWISPIR